MTARRLNTTAGLSNANEVFNINLTRDGKDVFPDPFNPTFTYPIFGEEETIVGYENPRIDLSFREYDLKPSLKFTYDKKMPPIGGSAKATEVEELLQEFLPEGEDNVAVLEI